jgi:uncharacterized delta-60 repeat protein
MLKRSLAGSLVFGVLGLAACGTFGSSDTSGAPTADGGAGEGAPPVDGVVDNSVTVTAAPGTGLVQGTTTKVVLQVKRGSGSSEPARISVTAGLRDGMTAAPIDVPASAATAELAIVVPDAAVQGPITLTLSAAIPQQTSAATIKAMVRGKPGALDTTFGTEGRARHLFGPGKNAIARDLVVLADDRLVPVAECGANACAARTSAEGVADPTYGTGGSAALFMTSLGQAVADGAGGVLLSSNGGAYSVKLGRLTATGQPDTAFGNGTGLGAGTHQFSPAGGGPPELTRPALAVRKDGTIAIAFSHAHGNGTQTAGLGLFTATAAPIAAFGTNGVTDGAQVAGATVPAVGFRANGDVWTAWIGPTLCYVYEQDGATGANAPSFGVGGGNYILCGTNPTSAIGAAVALPDGSLVPAYHSDTTVKLGKIVPDGSRSDLAWGNAGVATIAEDALPSVSLDKSGLVLVTLLRAGGLRFMRLSPSGAPDATFGASGTVVDSFGTNHQIARALVQSDGRIVVLGTEDFADGSDVSLSRYWN